MSGLKSLIGAPDFQNAKRRAGRLTAPARPNLPRYGLKKPEICLSPNGLRRNAAVPAANPVFRAALPIWGGNRGDSRGDPANLHTFLCITCAGPFCRPTSVLRSRIAG